MERHIWETDEEEARLWDEDPVRAARLAYLRLQCYWHDQVQSGVYRGIPVLNGAANKDLAATDVCPTIEPDSQPAVHFVPREIRKKFVQLCA